MLVAASSIAHKNSCAALDFQPNRISVQILFNGVARTLKKKYAHQRETTGTSSDSLQSRPFSKKELLLKETVCSQRERILSFKEQFLFVWKITFNTV